MGATVRLPQIIDESRAQELILLGEVIDAAEALRIGLANRVVASQDLDAAAAELAGRPPRTALLSRPAHSASPSPRRSASGPPGRPQS